MIVRLYNYNKRKNSAARPTGGTQFSVTLKAPCSVLNPVLEFKETPYAYNYAYIEAFSRYYYISEYAYERGIWTAQLSVDPLASWIDYLRNATAQVIFSSSHYNLDLLDNRIAATGRITRTTTVIPFQGAKSGAQVVPQGTFCLVALDSQGLWATGATTTYFMTYEQMQSFVYELIDPSTWKAIQQYFENPMDAIIECYYLPIDISGYASLSQERALEIAGYTFSNATAKSSLSTDMAVKTVHTTIGIEWPYDDFRRLSPYTTIEMFVPFCGSQSISPESCYQMEQLQLDYGVDITSGNVQAIVYLEGTVLQEWTGNMKISLPLAQTQARVDQVVGAVGGIVTAGIGVASGNVAMGASGVLSAISSAVSPASQKTMGGLSGSILGAVLGNDLLRWQQFRLSVTSHETNTDPETIRATIGNVNGSILSLSELTGYLQTAGASVSAPCTDTELDIINQMLDSGIYL